MSYDNSNSADLIFADLQDIANEFDAVEPSEGNSFEDLPDGKYTVRVDRLFFDTWKEGERPILKWEMVVVDGQYEGAKQRKTGWLTNENNAKMFKADLLNAGLDMNGRGISFAVLPNHLEELIDVMLEITVKRSKGDKLDKNGNPYVNVYINKRISDPFDDVDTDTMTERKQQTVRPTPTAAPRTSTSATKAREQF